MLLKNGHFLESICGFSLQLLTLHYSLIAF